MCSKNGVFATFEVMYGAQEFFWFFSQMSSFSTTLSLQNELLNSHERFFFHKDTAISSHINLMSIHIDSLVHTILHSKIYIIRIYCQKIDISFSKMADSKWRIEIYEIKRFGSIKIFGP